MAAPPEFMDLTCPVCGNEVQAAGRGNLEVAWVNNVLTTRLSYTAMADHVCPGISMPQASP